MIVRFTRRAERDMDCILFDLEERAGLTIALQRLDRIERRSRSLEQFPERGPRLRRGREGDLRYLIEGRYLIIYRVRTRSVDIVTVLHGARNLAAVLDDEGEQ